MSLTLFVLGIVVATTATIWVMAMLLMSTLSDNDKGAILVGSFATFLFCGGLWLAIHNSSHL